MTPKTKQDNSPESKPNSKDNLKSLPMPQLQERLESSPDGLSEAEAEKRLTQYGPNEIQEKQTNAFLLAVYGLFMTPIGWGWALFVWGYSLAWFLVNDRVKLLAYQIFDPTAAPLLAKTLIDRERRVQ